MDGFIDLWKYSELPDYILFLSSSTLTCKKSNLKKRKVASIQESTKHWTMAQKKSSNRHPNVKFCSKVSKRLRAVKNWWVEIWILLLLLPILCFMWGSLDLVVLPGEDRTVTLWSTMKLHLKPTDTDSWGSDYLELCSPRGLRPSG